MSYLTVCRLAREGKVPACKVGGGWRFNKAELDALLSQKGTQSLTAAAGNILVVDDDSKLREALAEVVSGENFEVVVVGTGEEALQEIGKRVYDLVFLDLVLPGMSGVEVFRSMRARAPETLVALVTGYSDDPMALEALSMSPLLLIRKPFKVQDIRRVLNAVASGSARQHMPDGEGSPSARARESS